jgi:hypothetical protein
MSRLMSREGVMMSSRLRPRNLSDRQSGRDLARPPLLINGPAK